MVTWLASYPRSGNTLLRIILNQCFDINTFSVYNDYEFTVRPTIAAIVGHQNYRGNVGLLADLNEFSSEDCYVKTHKPPQQDTNKTIYVVRDGRAAIVSMWHYMNEIAGLKIGMEDVIRGVGHAVGFSWSEHVVSWIFSGRQNTLVLHYEDLASVAEKADVLETISRFINRPIKNEARIDFRSLHEEYPSFFRCGSNIDNIKEMSKPNLELFHQLHGPVFSALGYQSTPPHPASNPSQYPAVWHRQPIGAS